jgi:hypothetical protein
MWSRLVKDGKMGFRKIALMSTAALVAAAAAVAAARRPGSPAMNPVSPAPVSPSPPLREKIRQPWWNKYRRSLILGLLGLAMLPAGFILYPSAAEVSAPGYSQLVIKSNTPIGAIQYGVAQASGAAAEITVRITLAPGAAARTATLTLLLPFGDAFMNCNPPDCHGDTPAGSYWSKQLTLRSSGGSLLAIPHAFVKAENFGEFLTALPHWLRFQKSTITVPLRPEQHY